jgi:hypothetical protein
MKFTKFQLIWATLIGLSIGRPVELINYVRYFLGEFELQRYIFY